MHDLPTRLSVLKHGGDTMFRWPVLTRWHGNLDLHRLPGRLRMRYASIGAYEVPHRNLVRRWSECVH